MRRSTLLPRPTLAPRPALPSRLLISIPLIRRAPLTTPLTHSRRRTRWNHHILRHIPARSPLASRLTPRLSLPLLLPLPLAVAIAVSMGGRRFAILPVISRGGRFLTPSTSGGGLGGGIVVPVILPFRPARGGCGAAVTVGTVVVVGSLSSAPSAASRRTIWGAFPAIPLMRILLCPSSTRSTVVERVSSTSASIAIVIPLARILRSRRHVRRKRG